MQAYQEGLELFDRGEYWEACIVLEGIWQREETELCQGLIYLSAGLWHLQAGSIGPGRRLLELAVEMLAPHRMEGAGHLIHAVVQELRDMRYSPQYRLPEWRSKYGPAA